MKNLLFRQVGSAIALVAAAILAGCGQTPKTSEPVVVMISVDGMRPDYVTQADAHGAKVPNLRQLMKDGAYAEGVQGVIPTVTYPSHTTLVTGVWPVKHNILNNQTFDPLRKGLQGWYWYAEDRKVPTLWDAAAQAGRKTASVQWPVTIGAKIDWNTPEVWRANTEDDQKLVRAVSTPGLLEEMQGSLHEEYRGGIDITLPNDELRGRAAQWILENKHPGLLTLHLLMLDHVEHETGPFSPEAIATLEGLDKVIGNLRASCEKVAPGACIFAVVSDHGFVKTDKIMTPFPAFVSAGLITLDAKGEKITDWKSIPWLTGGAFAVVLKDPNDAETLKKTRELLAKLAADPKNGIDQVLEADELHKRGGFSNASFLAALKPGWHTGGDLKGPLVTPDKPGGTHGYLPDLPDLRSAFFVVGPGIPAAKDLGVIDMRDIAPTLAHRARWQLPTADGKILLE